MFWRFFLDSHHTVGPFEQYSYQAITPNDQILRRSLSLENFSSLQWSTEILQTFEPVKCSLYVQSVGPWPMHTFAAGLLYHFLIDPIFPLENWQFLTPIGSELFAVILYDSCCEILSNVKYCTVANYPSWFLHLP